MHTGTFPSFSKMEFWCSWYNKLNYHTIGCTWMSGIVLQVLHHQQEVTWF